MGSFALHSDYKATGDQPQAINALINGLNQGYREQTLLGVTGSGKTFTMAQIIEQQQRPTLVMAPNKTLAGQLYSEFKQFFPDNAVEYFISYYDYYQPEAYVPQTDTYIEKDSSMSQTGGRSFCLVKPNKKNVPLFALESIVMVIIRNLQLALIDGGNMELSIKPWDIVIDMSVYLENYDAEAAAIQSSEACRNYESLLLEAEVILENAHATLKELKKTFTAFMDFEQLDRKRQEVLEDIINNGARPQFL